MIAFLPLFIYALIGICAGFLGGLLGIGGGIVVVPSLLLTFAYFGPSTQYAMQVAIGTSLGAMVFTAISSGWSHYLKGGIYWHYFLPLAPGIIVGAILGGWVADSLPSKILSQIFGVSLFLIGIYFLSSLEQKEQETQGNNLPPFILGVMGIGIGAFSSILGIGGGIMTVPLLVHFRTPLRNAISTSAALGFCIALFGAISFLSFGLLHESCSKCLGYLYVPAFIVIGIASSAAAPYGAKWVYILPTAVLRKIFGLFLIAVGIWMFFS